MTEVAIIFGAICSPLQRQLKDQGISLSKSECDVYQKDADAIVRLHLHGFMADAEVRRVRQRLLKKLVKRLRSVTPEEQG